MKKYLKLIGIAGLAAMISAVAFTGCSNSLTDFSESTEDASRSAYVNYQTIYSDLTPAYGEAVYFTGTFKEGENWTKAIRGTYVDGKWTCKVTSNYKFEYKALVGSWNEGEVVECYYPGLKELGEATLLLGYMGGPTNIYYYNGNDINYGEAAYFSHANKPEAVRGTYVESYSQDYSMTLYNSWLFRKNYKYGPYVNVKVYVGDYNLGDEILPEFKNLTWESGENHVYNK